MNQVLGSVSGIYLNMGSRKKAAFPMISWHWRSSIEKQRNAEINVTATQGDVDPSLSTCKTVDEAGIGK